MRFTSLIFFISTLFPFIHCSFAQSFLNTGQEIDQYLSNHSSSTMEDFIAKLSPDIRSNFQLIYHSRSPIGATLEFPRVVLSDRRAKIFIGFAGDASLKNGNIVEIIEAKPNDGRLTLRKITFQKNSPVEIEHNPTSCLECHGNPGSEFTIKPARLIWDDYPLWPGVYGSSHSQKRMGGINVGASTIPVPQFEENGLIDLQKRMPPRYANLIGFKEIAMRSLESSGSIFTEALAEANYSSLIAEFRERARLLSLEGRYAEIRNQLIEYAQNGTVPAQIEKQFKTMTTKSADEQNEVEDTHDRYSQIVKKYGLPIDQELLEKIDLSKKKFAPLSEKQILKYTLPEGILPLILLGIDINPLASTLSTHANRNQGLAGTIARKSHGSVFAYELYKTFDEESGPWLDDRRHYFCERILSGTNIKDPDKYIYYHWVPALSSMWVDSPYPLQTEAFKRFNNVDY